MDSSFREQESHTQKTSTGFWAGRRMLVSLINWLVSLIRLTEEEREEAGIYLGHPDGE
jgi:hypothetical protein